LILGLLPRHHTHNISLNMVFSFSADTLTLGPESLLFDVPDLESLHDNLDWLPSAETSDQDEEFGSAVPPFDIDCFEFDDEVFEDEHLALAEKLWANPPHDSFDFDQILESSSSSPIDDFANSEESSDAEGDDSASSSKAAKRKASGAFSDEDFNVKKVKGKKGVTKKSSKNVRRFQDVATLKTINQLRSEAADHPDSRRRIHNVLERKRRNDLKYCYSELRESIPDLEGTDRAPTGTILARAADYVRMLQEEEKKIDAGLAAARAENETLRRQLGLI
jgi:hypothetical protein